MNRWVRMLAVCAAVAVLIVIVGATWNWLQERSLLAHNHPPGRFFLVNGKTMHLNCSGLGQPTIVAEAGGGEDSLTWTPLQNSLQRQFRFCSYDRAGAGWSEPQPGARDADAVARQLNTLLGLAGEHGPFVLLAHSQGGLYILSFQQSYPSQTAALIFMDATTPSAYEGDIGRALGADEATLHKLSRFNFPIWALQKSGLARLMGLCSNVPPSLASVRPLLEADQCITSQDTEQQREFQALDASKREISSSPLPVPVLILSEDNSPILHTPEAITAWNTRQANMLGLASKSYRVIATHSDHFLQLNCQRFVTEQISRFLRGSANERPPYGTTTEVPCS